MIVAGESKAEKAKMNKEETLWKQVANHPHIVDLVETCRDSAHYYFLMERCEGSMADFNVKGAPALPEQFLLDFFPQMLLGLQHCHKKHVVHRDVKPANFLLSKTGTVKLCDFGVAKMERPGLVMTGMVGSAPFVSPEMVSESRYDRATDIWSFGATAFTMLYNRHLYAIEKDESSGDCRQMKESMLRAIASNTPEPTFGATKGMPERSQIACGFVKKILCRDPTDRLCAGQCVELAKATASDTQTVHQAREECMLSEQPLTLLQKHRDSQSASAKGSPSLDCSLGSWAV
jgi:serine/threonine protein kinase